MRTFCTLAVALALWCGLFALTRPAVAEMEQTVKAFAAWQGRGQMFETGPEKSTFVGSFSGMIYVETEKGPIDAGFMVCPVYLDVSLKDGSQEGKGRCVITGKDGSRAYAKMECKGVHLIGCEGEFTFTAGTEQFEGITGGGPFTVRSGISEFAAASGNIVQESAGGIIVWPKLTYRLPNVDPAAQ